MGAPPLECAPGVVHGAVMRTTMRTRCARRGTSSDGGAHSMRTTAVQGAHQPVGVRIGGLAHADGLQRLLPAVAHIPRTTSG